MSMTHHLANKKKNKNCQLCANCVAYRPQSRRKNMRQLNSAKDLFSPGKLDFNLKIIRSWTKIGKW